MTIFAVLMPNPQAALVERIQAIFPADHYHINETQWLISAPGTAMELTTRLGIADPNNTSLQPIGLAIVFATSSYYGRAPQPVWDWIKAKLEARPNA